MTVAIFDIRPTSVSGREFYVGTSRHLVPRLAVNSQPARRRGVQCHWRRDRDGRLVCVWDSVPRGPLQPPKVKINSYAGPRCGSEWLGAGRTTLNPLIGE